MDKKIYQIEIQGLKTSSEQVDVLLAKLNELDGKLKDINKGGVKISIGGGTKKVTDEIDTTANTLAALRKQLANLKKELANTEIGSDEFDDLRKKTLDLNTQVKNLEQSYGVFNRNVGNYTKSFIAAFAQFPQAVQDSIKNLNGFNDNANTLRTQLKSCKDAMDELTASGQQNSEAYNALKSVYAELADEQDKFNNELKNATDNTKGLTYTVSLFQELADAYTIATAASQLFGKSNDDVVKGIAKLQQLQAIANSLKNIQSSFQNGGKAVQIWNTAMKGSDKVLKALKISTQAEAAAQGTLSTATLVSANAMKILRVAIASTGIGLLVVAIGSLIGYMTSLESESEKLAKGFDDIAQSTNRAIDSLNTKKELGIISSLEAANQALKTYEEQIKQTFENVGKIIDEKTNNNWFTQMFGGDLKGITDKLGKGFIEWQKQIKNSVKSIEDAEKALIDLDKWEQKLQEDGASDEWLQMIEKIREALENVKKGIVDVQKEQKQLNEDISQMNIDAMADGYNKQLAQLNENYRKEQEKYKDNKEAQIALEKKHQRELTNLNREWGNKRLEVERQIASNELAAQKNNLAIRLKQIELERQREIEAARNSNIRVQETIASINAKYDYKVTEEKKKYYDTLTNMEREYNIRMSQLRYENTQNILNQQKEAIDNYKNMYFDDSFITPVSYDTKEMSKLSDIFDNLKQSTDRAYESIKIGDKELRNYNVDLTNYNYQIEAYNEGILNSQIELHNKLREDYQQYWDDRSETEMREIMAWHKREEKAILDSELLEEDKNKALINLDSELEQKLTNRQQKFNQDQIKKQQEFNIELSNIYEQGHENVINTLRQSDTYLREYLSNMPQANNWNIINYNHIKQELDNALTIYETWSNKINDELTKLQEKFKEGLITSEAYTKIKQQLLALGVDVNNAFAETTKQSETLLSEYIQSINQYVQVGIQGFSEITNSVFDVIQFNLDKQMEALEEENDRLQNLLDKQEDMISRHNDNINNIEGELGSARGDRRDQLIAALNAEKLAREQAYQEQKKLEKEKEKNERKQKELEKKQRKEQWKNQVMQAIASSALATANGLATQPFMPVGIAMGALATTLGAVQIALLRKQKPYKNGGSLPTKYADGGVIKGKSHAQGGVPIVGLSRPVEVEGQEFITNKMTTQLNLPLLEFINKQKHRININDLVEFYGGATSKKHSLVKTHFAEGGQLPTMDTSNFARNLTKDVYITDDRPIVVSVQEITDTQSRMARVRELANV